MQPSSAEGGGSDTSRLLRRYGPIAVLAIIVIVVVAVILTGGDDDEPDASVDDADTTDTADPDAPDPSDPENPDDPGETTAPDGGPDPEARLTPEGRPIRDGVTPLSWAIAEGIEDTIEWGPRCDLDRGTIAIPDAFAVECMAPWEGDNGGATAQGVTEDSIKIVWWISQDQDPILQYITAAIINDDTNADDEHTMRGLLELFETYYETYGRSVELIVYEGSGNVNDVGAAVADAKAIAEDIQPFMVWGGPILTNAFAQELHEHGIPCYSCTVGVNYEYYEDNPGLAYTIGKGGEQLDLLVAEYIAKRLAGDPAVHAGDESMHDQERVFGRIWITTGEGSETANANFEAALDEYGVEVAESQSYVLDPGTIQEAAGTVIARMKEAGVTSVILATDPVAPRDFTTEATEQNYFPEWIVTGSALVDTTAFARSYDQEQWANAFGISNLSARVERGAGGIFSLYEWFHGEAPQADDNIGVISPNPQTFYSFLQAVGPDLTVEGLQEAMFNGLPSESRITSPSLAWGTEGIWPEDLEPDYRGVDDISEIWWDVDQEGRTEIDDEGIGMWRWVDGGVRFKPGEIPEGPPEAFVEEGSVAIYEERPPAEQYPGTYEPLPPG